MIYLWIKYLHIGTALLSGAGFLTRVILVQLDHSAMKSKWVKVLPHVNDSILLACAIYLAVITHQYPFQQSWLTAKIVALVFYIVFGTWAIKRGKTKQQKAIFAGLALSCYGYIILVALNRSILPF